MLNKTIRPSLLITLPEDEALLGSDWVSPPPSQEGADHSSTLPTSDSFLLQDLSVPPSPATRNYRLSSWDHPVNHHHGIWSPAKATVLPNRVTSWKVHNGVANSEAVPVSETVEVLKGNWDRQGFGTQIKFFTPRKFGSSASIQFGKL